jgi:hypothetical protein
MSSLKYVGVLAFLLLASTAAMAAPVSSNISACVNNSTGAVRIVASTSLCVAGEIGTSWAVTGAVGPTGPQGPAGPAGPQGPQGATGATGAQGPIGNTGPQGTTGPAGPAGATGATGSTGAAGPAGPQGPPVTFKGAYSGAITYAIGDVVTEYGNSYIALQVSIAHDPYTDIIVSGGYWAVLAAQGDTGPQGPQGVQGPQGAAGTNGTNGATGPAGPQGPPVTFKGAYSGAITYAIGDAVTEYGNSYIALKASIAHDPYTDIIAGEGYWAVLAAQGATGPQGPQGPAGTSGVVQGITTGTIANTATAGTGTASIGGTAANPTVNINFPNDVQSISAGTVSNSGTTGTLSIGGTATNPQINVNFPASSSSSGFTWVSNYLNQSQNTPFFFSPTGGGSTAQYNSQLAFNSVPSACTVKSLQVYAITSDNSSTGTVPEGETATFKVYHNDSAQSMTCSVSTTASVGSTGSCSDTTHTFAVIAGDRLSIGATENVNDNAHYDTVSYGMILTCQ